ncbi:MAG: recombination mediator RecR [Candidatus Moranbacteria bacterium]|nr:recombination mediator RecR [Candidatus Moranbacteria bacterium]
MYPKPFKKLIDHFASLPSVGPKMAERLVIHLFKQNPEKITDFAQTLTELKTGLRYCQKCFNLSENEICSICADPKRDRTIICVVEEPLDIFAIEKTRQFSGLYHALGGVLENLSAGSSLKITELQNRIKDGGISEVIIAMNPTTEGDATALYINRILKDYPVKVTRLARGLSTGGDIEYADELTLSSALNNRIKLN